MKQEGNNDFVFSGKSSLNEDNKANYGRLKPLIDAYIEELKNPINYHSPWMLQVFKQDKDIGSAKNFSEIINKFAPKKLIGCDVCFADIKSRSGEYISSCMYYGIRNAVGDMHVFITKFNWKEIYYIYFPVNDFERAYNFY